MMASLIGVQPVRPRRAAEVRVSAQRPRLTRYLAQRGSKMTEVKIEVRMPHFSLWLNEELKLDRTEAAALAARRSE